MCWPRSASKLYGRRRRHCKRGTPRLLRLNYGYLCLFSTIRIEVRTFVVHQLNKLNTCQGHAPESRSRKRRRWLSDSLMRLSMRGCKTLIVSMQRQKQLFPPTDGQMRRQSTARNYPTRTGNECEQRTPGAICLQTEADDGGSSER